MVRIGKYRVNSMKIMANFENINQTEVLNKTANLSDNQLPQIPLSLKIIEYLCLASAIALGLSLKIWFNNPIIIICFAAFLGLFLFFFLVNRKLYDYYLTLNSQSTLSKRAQLYTHLLGTNSSEHNAMTSAREQALQYCYDLVNDYKKTRRDSRNAYYIAQILTVILSGVTPILVLLEKLDAGLPWMKWLPVICPAIAAIIASIVTSFPLQENWIAANTTVELLEAEQEKFILGVTPLYSGYDVVNEEERKEKGIQAIENFIVQVNNIHLKQVQSLGKQEQTSKAKDE